MEQTLDAVANPTRANQLVAQALSESESKAPEMPTPTPPPDLTVKLLAGAIDMNTATIVHDAEVRELNGFDEEILTRIPAEQPGRLFAAILRQGVVRIGQEKATQQNLDNLLMGDRDTLLLAVRKATWGDDVEMTLYCHSCESTHQYKVSITDDVPNIPLVDDERRFTVTLKDGREVEMHLPDGHTQAALLALGGDSAQPNRGQINTALLASCVDAIGDIAVMGSAPLQNLKVRDRALLVAELSKRIFGPQLGEVKVPCQTCGEKLYSPLSLGALFLL